MPRSNFTPPPGWPQPPAGWSPSPGWRPDPAWPPAPPGWNFYPTNQNGAAWGDSSSSGLTATHVVSPVDRLRSAPRALVVTTAIGLLLVISLMATAISSSHRSDSWRNGHEAGVGARLNSHMGDANDATESCANLWFIDQEAVKIGMAGSVSSPDKNDYVAGCTAGLSGQ